MTVLLVIVLMALAGCLVSAMKEAKQASDSRRNVELLRSEAGKRSYERLNWKLR